ncbi:MAG: CDP-alcohol phosphatidyltransferase family protein, partial [Clostridia bacterium]|nr:CDP-alcohol phosphatidyltransferase family protein [Clostridia bacterium]
MSNQGMNTLRAQFEDMGQNVWTIPNVLSMLRIIAIPFFVYFFVTKKYLIAVLVILISGLTDLFDGKIARRFNQISKLGKLLDPAADKLT